MSIHKSSIVAVVVTAAIAGPVAGASACIFPQARVEGKLAPKPAPARPHALRYVQVRIPT